MSVEVMNQRRFDRLLRVAVEDIGITVQQAQRKIALDIFGDLVAETPIKTGRAMNNWNISVNIPDRTITDVGGTEGAIESIKQSAALQALSELAPFSTVYLSNSLPYIVDLNEGSSDQAPAYWVDRAIFNNLNAFEAIG